MRDNVKDGLYTFIWKFKIFTDTAAGQEMSNQGSIFDFPDFWDVTWVPLYDH